MHANDHYLKTKISNYTVSYFRHEKCNFGDFTKICVLVCHIALETIPVLYFAKLYSKPLPINLK